jgi:hypothetical protein
MFSSFYDILEFQLLQLVSIFTKKNIFSTAQMMSSEFYSFLGTIECKQKIANHSLLREKKIILMNKLLQCKINAFVRRH